MARKPRKLTEQESLVTAFCRRSISGSGTFHPQQWSSGTEPADMVIIVGRSALLFNMTASGSYLRDLIKHNSEQFPPRLREWAGGKQLRGKNERRSFAISWDQVDHIVAICVVDGPFAACSPVVYPDEQPGKVRMSFALTSVFLQEFAKLGGSARDLIRFVRLHLSGSMSSDAAIAALHTYYSILRLSSGTFEIEGPRQLGRAIVRGRQVSWFDEQFAQLLAPRQHQDAAMERFSDYSWTEVFPVILFITISCREMLPLPGGQIRAAAIGQSVKMQVVVSSNMEGLAANTESLIKSARDNNCPLSYFTSITSFGLLSHFALDAEPHPWAIDADLASV